jgi:excisionase family DNA binding protein
VVSAKDSPEQIHPMKPKINNRRTSPLWHRQSTLCCTNLAFRSQSNCPSSGTYRDSWRNIAITFIDVAPCHKQVIMDRQRPEWMDLRALQQYACVSERTLREWIHRPTNPLPAARVGSKLLVKRSMFDHWLEAHQLQPIDVGCMVDEILTGVMGPN